MAAGGGRARLVESMQIGQASLNNVPGTLVFMLALLSFFWFLTGWREPSRDLRRFRILITALIIVSTLLAGALASAHSLRVMTVKPHWIHTGQSR
jgi:hypothetical protein